MKVEFKKGKYPNHHTISEGYATIVIENGVAEIDITDEDVVRLVARLGGRYAPPKETKEILIAESTGKPAKKRGKE